MIERRMTGRAPPRPDPRDQLPARDLHCEMRDKECGRQEADGPKANAVCMRRHFRGRPHVRNVEADCCPEGKTGGSRGCVALRTL